MAKFKRSNSVSPLRYPGGKQKLSRFLCDLMMRSKIKYNDIREPFFGGGSFTLFASRNLRHSAAYWGNDSYEPLSNFWIQFRDNRESLIDKAYSFMGLKPPFNLRPGSTKFSEYVKSQLSSKLDKNNDLDRAVEFYVLNRSTANGGTYSAGFSQDCYFSRFCPNHLENARIMSIPDGIKITNRDYKGLFLFTSPQTFIYLDPPYLSNKKSKLYGFKGSHHVNFDHEDFSEFIKIDSDRISWMLTLDDCDEVRKMFRGYPTLDMITTYSMRKQSKKVNELVIMSPKFVKDCGSNLRTTTL